MERLLNELKPYYECFKNINFYLNFPREESIYESRKKRLLRHYDILLFAWEMKELEYSEKLNYIMGNPLNIIRVPDNEITQEMLYILITVPSMFTYELLKRYMPLLEERTFKALMYSFLSESISCGSICNDADEDSCCSADSSRFYMNKHTKSIQILLSRDIFPNFIDLIDRVDKLIEKRVEETPNTWKEIMKEPSLIYTIEMPSDYLISLARLIMQANGKNLDIKRIDGYCESIVIPGINFEDHKNETPEKTALMNIINNPSSPEAQLQVLEAAKKSTVKIGIETFEIFESITDDVLEGILGVLDVYDFRIGLERLDYNFENAPDNIRLLLELKKNEFENYYKESCNGIGI